MNTRDLIGRKSPLFAKDVAKHEEQMTDCIRAGRFLVVGGAGTIGHAVVREIFSRNPRVLHVVDISENNLVEVVRDLRSSLGYIEGDFQTFALDFGSEVFANYLSSNGPYDYIFNLAALKHVRSEKDPFTLMRMIDVNVLNTAALHQYANSSGASKYFCVSTDKATNPANMMGCSKRIMELFLFGTDLDVPVSTARFANVAFSDGSLLHGFARRIEKGQPLSAPNDVRRYFITQQESGQLCLLSGLLGAHAEIFFPRLDEKEDLLTFSEIARRYLASIGYEAVVCASEEEARNSVNELKGNGKWPVYFFGSDTTGEKPFEEFFTADADLNLRRFLDVGVIQEPSNSLTPQLAEFRTAIAELRRAGNWSKEELVEIFSLIVPEFVHSETGKSLDGRM